MKKCMSCEKSIFSPQSFGDVILCKKCASSINLSAWCTRDFASMNDLMNQKKVTIQKATSSNVSAVVIEKITAFFDEYINMNFIASADGKLGQTLKVFENQCIITTKSEGKKDSLSCLFCDINTDDDDDEADDKMFSSTEKMSLVQGLMSGRIVQTGIGAVASAAIRKKEKEKNEAKKAKEKQKQEDILLDYIEQKITVGERVVRLDKIAKINIVDKRGFGCGYLQFIHEEANDNLADCDYFFFNDSKKIKKLIQPIVDIINEKISTAKDNAIAIQKETTLKKETNAFEEIRQFKQLLDEGIISEEEFNAKKQQLLSL